MAGYHDGINERILFIAKYTEECSKRILTLHIIGKQTFYRFVENMILLKTLKLMKQYYFIEPYYIIFICPKQKSVKDVR